MQGNIRVHISFLWICLLLSACNAGGSTPTPTQAAIIAQGTGYPAPGQPTPLSGYPAPGSTQPVEKDMFTVPAESAFQVLSVAQKRAQEWKKGAVLYGIPRLRQMEMNLSLPTGPQGWFFMFKDPTNLASPLEFYIEVLNGKVEGTNEVQKVRVGPPPYKEVAIDLTQKLLDSPEIYKIFMENGGTELVKGKGKVELDFQLINIEGMKSPAWCLYPGSDINAKPYKCIDAISGKVIGDPLEKFRK